MTVYVIMQRGDNNWPVAAFVDEVMAIQFRDDHNRRARDHRVWILELSETPSNYYYNPAPIKNTDTHSNQ